MKLSKHEVRVPEILTITGKTQSTLQRLVPFHQNGIFQQISPELVELLLRLLGREVVVKNPNRRITVSADMYVEDDENFGSNETARRQKTNAAILSTQGLAQSVMDFEVRMGGEIRVEFTVTAALVDASGNAMIDGDIKLYEGASESTGDLDGQRQFQLYCPVGTTINHFVRVNNDDEGGDYTTIRINITNAPA
jgi:hypothetical protein